MIRYPEAAAGAAAWWRSLRPDPERNRPGDRAALARLRRCGRIAEAMAEPATIDLFRFCAADHRADLPRVALCAAVLAWVRTDDGRRSVARQVGPGSEAAESALVKPLRFGRIMTAVEPDERLDPMRRLVALADGTLNVRDLAEGLLFWTDNTRQRWIYDYWDAGRPVAPVIAPAATAATSPAEDPAA